MYTNFRSSNSINKTLNTIDPTQTQLETLQREVDNYTRKLQQEKRKFFGIQDSLKSVNDEYQKQKGKLNDLKKENSKAHNVMLQAKVKNLEANLDKAISSFNDTVAHNNKLKSDIDMLRRGKKNYVEMLSSLEEQIKRHQQESQQKLLLIQKKKVRAEQLKEQIIQVKSRNQIQRDQYLKQFDTLQKDYMNDKRDRETLKYQKNCKPEVIDTQSLLKNRLKKIVMSNKQKLKMIQQYKKHMKMIEEAFNDIRQKSGVNTLEEITNTFIKSEEQNYSLYNYMDQLSRNIDTLQDENQKLQTNIEELRQNNEHKKEMLKHMSAQERSKAELESYLSKKEQNTKELNGLVEQIKPILESTLMELSKSKYNDDPKKKEDYELNLNITFRNVEEYLSDLEAYINILITIRQQCKIKGVHKLKETSTSYSKPLLGLNYEQFNRQKNEIRQQNKFIDETKLKQYATEYLERKKNKGKDN